jgi:hypothetical protein
MLRTGHTVGLTICFHTLVLIGLGILNFCGNKYKLCAIVQYTYLEVFYYEIKTFLGRITIHPHL